MKTTTAINQNKLDVAIDAAIKRLQGSERGQCALKDFKAMMDNGANVLDTANGTALCVLVLAAIKEGKRDFLANIESFRQVS